jgi:hypothetical protein
MTRGALDELASELCRVFLGWRLREDEDALLALGEGALAIDLRTGEAWCDGDPIPPLFIAGELARRLEESLARLGAPPLCEARLEAAFAARAPGTRGPRRPTLDITGAGTLRAASTSHRASLSRGRS